MGSNKIKSNKIAIAFIVIAVVALFIISFLLNLPPFGYFLMYLPLLIGLFFTWGIYPRYSKSLKSYVDGILYFQSSIIAILLVMRTVVPVPDDFFLKHLQSLHGFFYVYAMAIVAVIKCCVSFCDGRSSYIEETNKIAQEMKKVTVVTEDKVSSGNDIKLNVLVGASIFTLILLILK